MIAVEVRISCKEHLPKHEMVFDVCRFQTDDANEGEEELGRSLEMAVVSMIQKVIADAKHIEDSQ